MFHRCLAVILGILLTAPQTLAQVPVSPESPSGPLASNPRPAEFRISDRVILVRDERMVQTHFTMVVHAGCLDEEPDCRGVAHYLEHLLLAGRNPDHTESASRFFSDGYANGWTSHKATAYVHRIAPRRAEQGGPMADLERLFAFYANRLRGFEVSAADVVRERNIVLQEYQLRSGNNPFGRFDIQIDKELFPRHSLGRSVIGSPETIAALTLEQAQRFHASWYRPDNITVVVAGNLDPEEVRAVTARTFGTLESRSSPRPGREVPEIEPTRSSLALTDAQVKRRTVRYTKLVRIPEETRNIRNARMLLADFLASRLAGSPNDVLVEGRSVTDRVGAGVIRHLPGLYEIWLSAEPTPDTGSEQLAEAMRSYLDGLASRGSFDTATLERLKRRFAADVATTNQSGEQISNRVVEWVANGDPYDSLADYPQRVAAVSADDVTHLLTLLAGPGREVTGILLPETTVDRRVP